MTIRIDSISNCLTRLLNTFIISLTLRAAKLVQKIVILYESSGLTGKFLTLLQTQPMRIVQVIAKPGCTNFVSLVKQKQRELKQKKRGTFYPAKPNKWKHVSYAGYINLPKAHKHVTLFEVMPGPGEGKDWQLLHSFLGFLDRHFHDEIESITIFYRDQG